VEKLQELRVAMIASNKCVITCSEIFARVEIDLPIIPAFVMHQAKINSARDVYDLAVQDFYYKKAEYEAELKRQR